MISLTSSLKCASIKLSAKTNDVGLLLFKACDHNLFVVGKDPMLFGITSRCLGGHAGDERHGVFASMPTGHYERKPRVDRVELTCEVCGEKFYLLPGAYKRRSKIAPIRFCSRECMGKGFSDPDRYVTLSCDQCGKSFSKRADHIRPNNYCSKACSGASRRVDGARWRDPQQIKAYMREYSSLNREAMNKQRRDWNKKNADKKHEIQKKYRVTHKAELLDASRARRAKTKAPYFNAQHWEDMKVYYSFTCLCCGRQEPEIKLEQDHIVPISKGGKHLKENIQPLCRSCNASKSDKTIDYRPDIELRITA